MLDPDLAVLDDRVESAIMPALAHGTSAGNDHGALAALSMDDWVLRQFRLVDKGELGVPQKNSLNY